MAQFGDIVLSRAHVQAADDAVSNSPPSSSTPAPLVAIKRISLVRLEELAYEGSTLEDLFQEVRVAAKIAILGGHPHVVQYLNSYIEDDHLCLVMQFCSNGDLLHALESRHQTEEDSTSMGEHDTLAIVSQITQALAFLHQRVGVAHRDVSLENVFMHDGQCKLGDFGLSVAVSARPSDSVGKMAYMAPKVVVAATKKSSYDPCTADV